MAVVGGGNTALDAIRTALRLGATKAILLYRRSEAEMPGRKEEIRHARDEGVELRTLAHPVEFLGDEKGWLVGARCVRMALGEPDASDRPRPVEVPGSEFRVPLDVAIVAVGAGPNLLVRSTTPNLATNARGYIVADPDTLKTSREGVFAGGDIVTGSATVILAMGADRHAARAIDDYHAAMDALERAYEATLGRLNRGYTRLLTFFLRRRLDLVMGLCAIFAVTVTSSGFPRASGSDR